MATVYPSYVPSTPSNSSQSSLPPSYAISVHDHVLPPGWQCKCDPKTGKYYFLNDHLSSQWDFVKQGQQSSLSSRASSPSHTTFSYKYFQPFTSRYKVGDSNAFSTNAFSTSFTGPHYSSPYTLYQKLCQQFPQVDEAYVQHLMKIYHNREHLVVSQLQSEGFNRNLQTQPDESLFYKLKSYFPNVEPDMIRQTLIKHNNMEHEVIAAIISTMGPSAKYQSTTMFPGSPKMKLRYLKLIYPDTDEAVLFDLLYNCDQNAQEAINRLEAMGYRRLDTGSSRPTSAKVSDYSIFSDFSKISKVSRPSTAPFVPRQPHFPPTTNERQKMFKTLEEEFPKANRTLINMALETSGFNVERARIFLNAMTPQDSVKYLPKDFVQVQSSPITTRSCRATQTNHIVGSFNGTPIKIPKVLAERKFITSATSTTEDGIFDDYKKKPVAKGADPTNRKGTNIINLIKSYLPWKGSDSKKRQGPDPNNRKGPDSLLNKGTSKGSSNAKGANPALRKGPLLSKWDKLKKRDKK